jgi:hypothetical protein
MIKLLIYFDRDLLGYDAVYRTVIVATDVSEELLVCIFRVEVHFSHDKLLMKLYFILLILYHSLLINYIKNLLTNSEQVSSCYPRSSVSEEHLMGLSMSVCLSSFSWEPGNPHGFPKGRSETRELHS